MTQESTTPDPMEMLRRLWAPLGVPVPGLAVPTLDPEEVSKRIADLRAVEGWLQLNLNMVKMAISALEVQRTALDAMRSGENEGPAPAAGPADPANPMMWPWALMQQALAPTTPPADKRDKPGASGKGRK
jgi:hypothetical protein